MQKTRGGFVGLIALLIGVAIIAFLIMRTDLFSRGQSDKSILEIQTDSVDKAKEAKQLIEQNSQKAVEE